MSDNSLIAIIFIGIVLLAVSENITDAISNKCTDPTPIHEVKENE